MFHQSLSISFCFLDSKPLRAFFRSLIDWDNWSADWRQWGCCSAGYYFLSVSLAQREAQRPDAACQFGCALMIPPVNCPGLVRHLHSVYCSFCVPVTDIYRSACKENISIFAEGEPVTTAFWYALSRERAHFTSAQWWNAITNSRSSPTVCGLHEIFCRCFVVLVITIEFV